jgi:hypothetical protein
VARATAGECVKVGSVSYLKIPGVVWGSRNESITGKLAIGGAQNPQWRRTLRCSRIVHVRISCVTESDSARIFGALRRVAVRGGVFSVISDVWRTEKFSLLIGRRCPAVHTEHNPNKQAATPLAYISDRL